MIRFKAGVLRVGVIVLLLQIVRVQAAESKPIPAGPIPTQISSARKVFIANGGADLPYGEYIFSGGPERAYNEFVAGTKSSGLYQLVESPAEADLLFEIEFTVPKSGPRLSQGSLGDVPYDPQFRLVIRDPKTNAMLWTIIEHVQWAMLQANHDKNFDLAITRLITDMQGLAARAAAVANAKL